MTFVSELEPHGLWRHFDKILTIPRGSKEEGAIRAYVIEVAERSGLEHRTDAAGNVVVKKPGTSGKENAGVTVLQGHLDMVNEKNSDVEHDFSKDPLIPERDAEYLTARGTTLGSDNGIGIAAMLAIMEADDLAHPPLELVFTIDEETGLTGAARLDASDLQGRRLLNLDTEEEGAIYVGCAGGGDSHLSMPVSRTATPAGSKALRLRLRGLKGGHSGVDIHLQRGNAVRLLARILHEAARGTTLYLADIEGGDKHNAIPRESGAVVVLPAGDIDAFRSRAEAAFHAVRTEFASVEPDMTFAVEAADAPAQVLNADSARRTVDLLNALPHGVMAMSYDIPDLVETSTNLARVRIEGGAATALMSSRSSVDTELEALRGRIRSIANLAGAAVKEEAPYPGWKPNLDSALLNVVKEVYSEDLGREPEMKAIHAGLETGIIGEKIPGMDMVSIGPQIEFPHSPDERVRIPSVADFWRMVANTLERLD